MRIPCRQQRGIVQTQHSTGLIKLGQRALPARSLFGADPSDISDLTGAQCLLDGGIAHPDEGIEQIVPVAGPGGDGSGVRNALLVMHIIRKRILIDEMEVMASSIDGGLPERVECSQFRPVLGPAQSVLVVAKMGENRMRENLRIDQVAFRSEVTHACRFNGNVPLSSPARVPPRESVPPIPPCASFHHRR